MTRGEPNQAEEQNSRGDQQGLRAQSLSETPQGSPSPNLKAPEVGIGALLKLAWPAVFSYTLSNSYRINDQFWIQSLGGNAQAAMGATMFVMIMNFAALFLAVGGTLALVARATGAGDRERRDQVLRSALLLTLGLAVTLSLVGCSLTPYLVRWLGLSGETAALASEYMGTLYAWILPMALLPVLDNALIGMGNTRVPLLMQAVSLSTNFVLNPALIYGTQAPQACPLEALQPVAEVARSLAEVLGIENGWGMRGAALATIFSRFIASAIGLAVLFFYYGFRPLQRSHKSEPSRTESNATATTSSAQNSSGFGLLPTAISILRISAPISASIALYAGVYWILLGVVLEPLGASAVAGLGIGFQVFEGVSYPFYLGVSQATASLIGRCLGAHSPASALRAVASSYRMSLCSGLMMALAFIVLGPQLVPLFTQDPLVEAQALIYVRTLALAQVFVAFESVNEKILAGAGMTRPTLLVAGSGNALRIPLAWYLAHQLDWGANGVWWAINMTSAYKAICLYAVVRRRKWLDHKI